MTRDLEVPVLIIGGGGCGLTSSMLLSQLGVETLLVSALPTTSTLPKAHVLNQRAMEILCDTPAGADVYAVGTPREHMRATAFYAGFAGTHPECGRRLAKLDSWGGGGNDLDWEAASPRSTTNLPQIRLEPILRKHAERLAPGRVRFHNEVTTITQSDDRVTATIRDHARSEEYRVHARWALACDGGRMVGRALGVEMEGARGLGNQVSIHMSADLSRWATDDDVLIRWIWIADRGGLAVLVPMGPTRWGRHSEEWVYHLNYPDQDPRALDDERVVADMRAVLGIGDHPVTVHKISRWSFEGVVASKFQVGRVLLLGDAAHRHPPTGGLGLTSAMHDAHNVCWKVAAVVQGKAAPALLETYEPERRPVVARNVERSLENAMNHFTIAGAIGVQQGDAMGDGNWAALARALDGDGDSAAHRAAARRAFATQTMEFREHNVEYGYAHASAAVVADGTPPPPNVDPIRVYVPSTRPGHPLPHAWMEDAAGTRRSTLDFVAPGRFVLFAGEEGGAWCDAARELARRYDLPLDAYTTGHVDGDLLDLECRWARLRGFGPAGAILVRPDRCVAWRSLDGPVDAMTQLRDAFARVLQRRLDA